MGRDGRRDRRAEPRRTGRRARDRASACRELAGAYLVPIVFVGRGGDPVASSLLRPDPYELADHRHATTGDGDATPVAVSLASVLARPHVPVAIVALVAGQVVMVLIMTMTPLHMAEHGHGLAAVGFVISGHTFGMFGLSPISGRLTDRFGSVPVILAGLATLAGRVGPGRGSPRPRAACSCSSRCSCSGYGWNLGYVAGSALLTHGLSLAERTRLQGLTDSLIWSSAAVASLGSGFVLALRGLSRSSACSGAALVVVPDDARRGARRSAVAG